MSTPRFVSQRYGLWTSLGDRQYAFTFIEVLYDDSGGYAGMLSFAGTLMLDETANSFEGTYTTTVTLADGTTVPPSGPAGTVTGTRVTIGS